MIHHLKGRLFEKNPTYLVIECNGVGYEVKISLNTYSGIGNLEEITLLTKLIVREDAQILYGFLSKEEREIFQLLISISGIGPNTAMIMLSSLSPTEIAQAIVNEDVRIIQSVKGIGTKTAQRVIIELQDKMRHFSLSEENLSSSNNTNKFDALIALASLGFDKKAAERALDKIYDENDSVENLIKHALKVL